MEPRVIKIFPYSYSSLTSFETCARKHYGERLSKEFERPFNKAATDGDIWHKEAEEYAKDGTPIPDTNPHRAKMMEILDQVRASGEGQFHAELELAITKDRKPCGWWDAEAYTRAKSDIIYIRGAEADSIDWKTGRSDPYSTQLLHSAILLFCHYPDLQKVNCRYEWLKEGFATKRTYHRDFMDEYWSKFEQRAARYKKAFDKNEWPANRNGLCGKYCGVSTCEFYGKSGR